MTPSKTAAFHLGSSAVPWICGGPKVADRDGRRLNCIVTVSRLAAMNESVEIRCDAGHHSRSNRSGSGGRKTLIVVDMQVSLSN